MALGTIPLAIIARITRASVLEVQNADYVRTARAKGLPQAQIRNRFVLRNAMLPVSTVVGLQVGLLLSGAVLIVLLATRRISRKSFIPFGPFLIIGALWAVLIRA